MTQNRRNPDDSFFSANYWVGYLIGLIVGYILGRSWPAVDAFLKGVFGTVFGTNG